MNLIVFNREELDAAALLRLSGSRAEHLLSVNKVAVGDVLRVGEIGGRRGRGTVCKVVPGEVALRVEFDEAGIQLPSGLNFIVALPRPQMLKRILEFSATVSASRVMLIRSSRVEKSFFQSPLLEESQIREHLVLGMEQGVSTWVPAVTVHSRFRRFVEDEMGELIGSSLRLLAHPNSAAGMYEAFQAGGAPAEVTVAIGPEGGWIEHEVELFEAHGFSRFHLGERVLRVDSAVCYAAAQYDLVKRLQR